MDEIAVAVHRAMFVVTGNVTRQMDMLQATAELVEKAACFFQESLERHIAQAEHPEMLHVEGESRLPRAPGREVSGPQVMVLDSEPDFRVEACQLGVECQIHRLVDDECPRADIDIQAGAVDERVGFEPGRVGEVQGVSQRVPIRPFGNLRMAGQQAGVEPEFSRAEPGLNRLIEGGRRGCELGGDEQFAWTALKCCSLF